MNHPNPDLEIGFLQLLGALYGSAVALPGQISCDVSWDSSVLKEAQRRDAECEPLSQRTTRIRFSGSAREPIARALGDDLRSPAWDEEGSLVLAQRETARSLAFLRGYCEARGALWLKAQRPVFSLHCPDPQLRAWVLCLLGPHDSGSEPVLGTETPPELQWHDLAALDACGRLWDESLADMPRELRAPYEAWLRGDEFSQSTTRDLRGDIRVERLRPLAVLPFKARVSDSGYDLCLIDVQKQIGKVVLYGTGLKVAPPDGFYFDIVPRSSIIKLGYLLANSVGVIDRAYRGELMVPLIKVDESAPDLELPARVVQMIPRTISHFPVVSVDELDVSDRGTKGFGSSGFR